MNLLETGRALLDLVYPRSCAGCGGAVGGEGTYLCWECLSQLLVVRRPFCAVCGDPVEGRVDQDFVCYPCCDDPPAFDTARSAARYDGVLRTALCELKYRKGVWMEPDLVQILHGCLTAHHAGLPLDAVVCVPLHPSKQRRRGYNQARLLAAGLARRVGLPLLEGVLERVRATPTQTGLTAPHRKDNVRNAFRACRGSSVAGRRLLLVDDVMTTGATLSECARALKKAGAASVHALSVARG